MEIFVAEVGDSPRDDQIYRLTYQGSVADEHNWAVMGGSTERVEAYLNDHFGEGLDLDAAVRLGVSALGHDTEVTRTIPAEEVEAAVLDRSRNQVRKFRRLSVADVQHALDSGEPEPTPDSDADTDADTDASESADEPPSDGGAGSNGTSGV